MYTELIREQKQSNYIVNSDSDIFINTDFSFNKYFTSKAQFQDFYQQSNKKKILWLHLWTLPLQMLCSVCTYPCKTTVQQVTSGMDVWQRQGRTAACTESESYEPQSGNAAGCASDTDVQGTLDKDFSTSLAWRKLVAAPLLYIPFSSYILPPICYSAGQARRVWICNRSYWTSVLRTKEQERKLSRKCQTTLQPEFHLWSDQEITLTSSPALLLNSKHRLPVCCLKSPGIKFIL